MNRYDKLRNIGVLLLCLLLAAVVLYSGFRFLEATVFLEDEEQSSYVSKTIEKDGIKYFPKQDMETMLVIGVDQEGPVQESEYYEDKGMADAVMVVIFDKKEETIEVVSLNRDTMTNVPVIGIDGKSAGTIEAQLAVSYVYGDGMEESCLNTAKAVSDLLYGTQIDHYVAMTMDGIKVLNDAVGGVNVLVTDDFSEVDPSITEGEMTLRGDQALTFIRARKDVGTQLNVSRMERQQVYMKSFFDALQDTVSADASGEFIVNTLEELSPYMVTDCSLTVLSSMMERYGEYELTGMVMPEGKNVRGEEYMEFYLDEDSFGNLVLDTFFAVKE
ncbi:MAG: LCP family protein [Firmicutes bacterium]|nr:LCP family protein [Bacillota bacterium]